MPRRASGVDGERARVITVAIVIAGLALTAPGATTNPWIIGVAVFVGGVANATWNVITVSLRQRIIPLPLLGRVTSGFRLLAWGTGPVGAIVGASRRKSWGSARCLPQPASSPLCSLFRSTA